jgi:hypothetical protein
MQFIFKLLQKVAAGMDANKAAKEAYAESLSHHHGYMIKKTFELGLMGAPSTETMLPCLGTDKVRSNTQSQRMCACIYVRTCLFVHVHVSVYL